MSGDRSQVLTRKHGALLVVPFVSLQLPRARGKYDKLCDRFNRSAQHMSDKYNLIVKHLFGKAFLETWRMEMSLWPLLEAQIYLYSKVTSVVSQGSLCCKRAPVSPNLSALRRKEKTEARQVDWLWLNECRIVAFNLPPICHQLKMWKKKS